MTLIIQMSCPRRQTAGCVPLVYLGSSPLCPLLSRLFLPRPPFFTTDATLARCPRTLRSPPFASERISSGPLWPSSLLWRRSVGVSSQLGRSPPTYLRLYFFSCGSNRYIWRRPRAFLFAFLSLLLLLLPRPRCYHVADALSVAGSKVQRPMERACASPPFLASSFFICAPPSSFRCNSCFPCLCPSPPLC